MNYYLPKVETKQQSKHNYLHWLNIIGNFDRVCKIKEPNQKIEPMDFGTNFCPSSFIPSFGMQLILDARTFSNITR